MAQLNNKQPVALAGPPLDLNSYAPDKRVAQLLSLDPAYLRQLRCKGGGPRYAKFGRAVRYRLGDVLEWAKARSVSSTSEEVAA